MCVHGQLQQSHRAARRPLRVIVVKIMENVHNKTKRGNNYMNKVTLEVPVALQQLIRRNNELLKKYQQELFDEIKQANVQLMGILQLNPDAGWKLDIENMQYVREEVSTPEKTEE